MSATNVQTAIDELYNTCFPKAGEQIIEDAGLEKDPYECRYFFIGANPNNYITFNGETAGWRIISVECDGTIKIMRNESIGNVAWDSSQNNNWARPADLNTYLNSTYLTNTLNATSQSQIVSKDWSIGNVYYENTDLVDQIASENSNKWNGKVSLPTVSEYIRSNSDQEYCGTFKKINVNPSMCQFTTWMDNSNIISWWALSPRTGVSFEVYRFYSQGIIGGVSTAGTSAVRPVVYLSSSIQITGGNGSQSNPFTIE